MNHSELAQLAQDIVGGKVFGSWMIQPEHMIYLERIFVPLQWASKGQYSLPEGIATLYEYRDKSWPLSVEGYPVFFSMKFLTTEELSKLQTMLHVLQSLKEEFDSRMRNLDEDALVNGSSGGDGTTGPSADQVGC